MNHCDHNADGMRVAGRCPFVLAILGAMLWSGWSAALVQGEDLIGQFKSYRVRVVARLPAHVDAGVENALVTQLSKRLHTISGGCWQAEVVLTNDSGEAWRLVDQGVPYHRLAEILAAYGDRSDSADKFDKILLLEVAKRGRTREVAACELDLSTASWGALQVDRGHDSIPVHAQAAHVVLRALGPEARILDVHDDQVWLAFRGAGLLESAGGTLKAGTPCRLIQHKPSGAQNAAGEYPGAPDDESGAADVAGPRKLASSPDVQPVWAVIDEAPSRGVVRCRLATAPGAHFETGMGRWQDWTAVLTAPGWGDCTLRLVRADNRSTPLAGWEIWSRACNHPTSQRIGRTDALGRLLLPAHTEIVEVSTRLANYRWGETLVVPGYQRDVEIVLDAGPGVEDALLAVADLQSRLDALVAKAAAGAAATDEPMTGAGSSAEQEQFLDQVRQARQRLLTIDPAVRPMIERDLDELVAAARRELVAGNTVPLSPVAAPAASGAPSSGQP